MSLQVQNANNVKIYTVSGSKGSRSIPDWLARRNKKALKNDLEWRHRIELIQDFEFPEASLKIKTTRDGKYAIATGVYKPQMRVYEYSEMSMKFDRHTDAENVDFQILSDDWTKTVHLQADRSIEFQAQGGLHFRTRIPKFGRSLTYHYPSCDLLVTASSNEIYRLNLEQGRFLNSLVTDIDPTGGNGVNCGEINPAHLLYGCGTDAGTVEFWDLRVRGRVGVLAPSLPESVMSSSLGISSMKFREDGLTMAVGTTTGHVLMYDLRSSIPLFVKDHQYGFPIKSLTFHEGTQGEDGRTKVVSADCKIIKIWDRENGNNFTSIEPVNDINDVCVVDNSGLMFVANEGIQMQSYYIPSLGPAPKWCSFLDNLTEELEENPVQNIYDDYKFVTRKELASLGLDHLVGSSVLKPYMHGFFIDLRLYEKAKAIANPFAYADYREREAKEKLAKEAGSRIRATMKLPKVNKQLATKMMLDEAKARRKAAASGDGALPEAATEGGALKDSRFADLFTNPDFQVDEDTNEYKLLNPVKSTAKPSYRVVGEDEIEEASEVSNSDGSDVDSDEDLIRVSHYKSDRDNNNKKKKADQITSIRSGVKDRKRIPKMEALKQRAGNSSGPVLKSQAQRSFAERVAKDRGSDNSVSRSTAGGMEMSFQVKGRGGKGGRGNTKSSTSSSSRNGGESGGGPQRRERRSAGRNTIRNL
ncbi:WD40-repeat-containing domain protein [Lobosporangium transversale]|uniref:WD40-repeat-containing domain protein n=1 Tax=Lobosporangium transversale TaxID=64571 RepID=A0A1Y2GJM6_9FUNG|nr:WD40-repeat-containing domain protein [Lobosporangium transversale]ORZ12940.1 WD40-repeat-containing domain protein [Lobosporangium transversale]|eukprot:XP_021880289.1 WD40-repeat-containing domain protein [Lobosporangium transversale]